MNPQLSSIRLLVGEGRFLGLLLAVLTGWIALPGRAQNIPATPARGLFEGADDFISPALESMYQRGLQYLVKSQNDQGSWTGSMGSQPAVVGLAVLSILAHGEDPQTGAYSATIQKGLKFILSQQNDKTGYIGSSMYNHGFATLALAEAYGAVDYPGLGEALQKAVDLILTSQKQNALGGWRYSPTSQDADTTVSGAQMVALFAARNAGLGVPEEAIETGLDFYRKCQSSDGGFGYTSAGGSNGPRTAVGALVFALAKEKKSREFKAAMRFLRSGNFSGGNYYHYFLYYGSQAFFHASPEDWQEWNRINVNILQTTQQENGGWNSNYGEAFGTACSLLSVALNYRYLPIYER